MDKVLIGGILAVLHLVLALYASLVIKDTLRFTANTKRFLYVVNFLVPLIGFAISMTIGGNKKKSFRSPGGYEGSNAQSDSSCDGGSGE